MENENEKKGKMHPLLIGLLVLILLYMAFMIYGLVKEYVTKKTNTRKLPAISVRYRTGIK